MHAIGYDPGKYFRRTFLGLHAIIWRAIHALGLPHGKTGFGGTWSAFIVSR